MINSKPDLTGTSVEFTLIPTIDFLQSQADFYWGGTRSTLTIFFGSDKNFSTIASGSSVYFEGTNSSIGLISSVGKSKIKGVEFSFDQITPIVFSPEIKTTAKVKKKPSSLYIANDTNVVLIGVIESESISTLAPLLSEAILFTERFLNTNAEEYFICFASGIDYSYTQSELGYIVGSINQDQLESSTSLIVPALIECNPTTPEFTATTEAGSNQDFVYFDTVYLKKSTEVLAFGNIPDVVFLYTNQNTVHNADLSIKQVKIRQELSWQTILI